MVTRVLACPECGLRIESNFKQNEFANLEDEWLHFLRIFIHCEGRIRDMEAALGVSYPTVKARIAELKSRLDATQPAPPAETSGARSATVREVLDLLESGEIDDEEAMKRIRESPA